MGYMSGLPNGSQHLWGPDPVQNKGTPPLSVSRSEYGGGDIQVSDGITV